MWTERFSIAFAKKVRQDGHGDILVTPKIWELYSVHDFLYSDVLPFLYSKNKDDITIVTAMTPSLGPEACDYQREKLKNGGFDKLVNEVILMIGDKGNYVRDLYTGDPTVFIDDKTEHLESTVYQCPKVRCVQIIRRNAANKTVRTTNPEIAVIEGLGELDAIIENT